MDTVNDDAICRQAAWDFWTDVNTLDIKTALDNLNALSQVNPFHPGKTLLGWGYLYMDMIELYCSETGKTITDVEDHLKSKMVF